MALSLGVTPEQLASMYPRLYHMAEPNSWENIRKSGLLCTAKILDECEISRSEREKIELQRRPSKVSVKHRALGQVVIRDQKPLIASQLARCLIDCSVAQWLQLLNGLVFFWPTRERLLRMMSAAEYTQQQHCVLTVDTLTLVQRYEKSVLLAPINTGNTRPFARPRSLGTLSRMVDYPFIERTKRGPYYTVVEVAVKGGVPDIEKFMIRAEHASCGNGQLETREILFEKATS